MDRIFYRTSEQTSSTGPQNIQAECQSTVRNLAKTAQVRKAIMLLRNGKAAEALKANIDTSPKILHRLLTKIREQVKIPEDCREGQLVLNYKKGDLHECFNYRRNYIIIETKKAAYKLFEI
jgi:hypothetical protein